MIVISFGRIYSIQNDLVVANTMEDEGGTGGAYKFWHCCEEQVKLYL